MAAVARCSSGEPRTQYGTDILAWVAEWNKDPKPFVWHKTAEEILQRFAGYCVAINRDAC
jgi:hypothetical protein